MDFEIPEELKEFIDGVRRFREREMMPLEREFLLNGDWDLQTRLALEEKARKAGFWALDVPVEDGGQGMDEFAMCLVAEEGVKQGEFVVDDVDMATLALFGMCNWAYQWYRPGGRLAPHEIAAMFWRIYANGIQAKPALA